MQTYKIIRNVGLVGILASMATVKYDLVDTKTLSPPDRIATFYEIQNQLYLINGYEMSKDSKLEEKCSALIKEWRELNSNQELLAEKEDFETNLQAVNDYNHKNGAYVIIALLLSVSMFVFGGLRYSLKQHK